MNRLLNVAPWNGNANPIGCDRTTSSPVPTAVPLLSPSRRPPVRWWRGPAPLALLPVPVVTAARGRAWLCFLGGGAAWYLAILQKQVLDPEVQERLYAPTPGAELATAAAL